METRRIRRLERQRAHRTAALTASAATAGVAVGLSLPRSATAAALLFALAVACLAVVGARADAAAPLHGVHHVVRLPLRTSVAATLESLVSRLAGSSRAALHRLRPSPTPLVLDEADDDAEAWWGVPGSLPVSPAPPLPRPVVSAPMASAHVPYEGGS